MHKKAPHKFNELMRGFLHHVSISFLAFQTQRYKHIMPPISGKPGATGSGISATTASEAAFLYFQFKVIIT